MMLAQFVITINWIMQLVMVLKI